MENGIFENKIKNLKHLHAAAPKMENAFKTGADYAYFNRFYDECLKIIPELIEEYEKLKSELLNQAK